MGPQSQLSKVLESKRSEEHSEVISMTLPQSLTKTIRLSATENTFYVALLLVRFSLEPCPPSRYILYINVCEKNI